jgi:hypothetical protein
MIVEREVLDHGLDALRHSVFIRLVVRIVVKTHLLKEFEPVGLTVTEQDTGCVTVCILAVIRGPPRTPREISLLPQVNLFTPLCHMPRYRYARWTSAYDVKHHYSMPRSFFFNVIKGNPR